jgi:hypothetical protein
LGVRTPSPHVILSLAKDLLYLFFCPAAVGEHHRRFRPAAFRCILQNHGTRKDKPIMTTQGEELIDRCKQHVIETLRTLPECAGRRENQRGDS